MRRLLLVLAAASAVLAPALAHAGVYSDKMSECVSRSITPQDKSDLALFIFASASLHPSVGSYAAITEEQRAEVSRKTSALVDRLAVTSCRQEMVRALKYEQISAIRNLYRVLLEEGKGALLGEPAVVDNFNTLDGYSDGAKLAEVVEESYRTVAKPAPK